MSQRGERRGLGKFQRMPPKRAMLSQVQRLRETAWLTQALTAGMQTWPVSLVLKRGHKRDLTDKQKDLSGAEDYVRTKVPQLITVHLAA